LRHLECDAARDIGLDCSGDDINGRTLRGEDHVDTGCTGKLSQTDNARLDFLLSLTHQFGQLIHDDDNVRQFSGYNIFRLIGFFFDYATKEIGLFFDRAGVKALNIGKGVSVGIYDLKVEFYSGAE
jgi:hypothetical protein